MEEVYVPRNTYGGYHVIVKLKDGAWEVEGLRDDFYALASMGWYYFVDCATSKGDKWAKKYLSENGFKLKPEVNVPG